MTYNIALLDDHRVVLESFANLLATSENFRWWVWFPTGRLCSKMQELQAEAGRVDRGRRTQPVEGKQPAARYPQQAIRVRTVHVAVEIKGRRVVLLRPGEVIQSRGRLLDPAALQAVSLMPRWFPAHRAGGTVASLVGLPVTFRID